MKNPDRRPAETETVEPFAVDGREVLLFAPGTRLAERYELHEALGQGGFAVVYRAFDHQLRQEIALKVLRTDRLTDNGLRRLQREAAVARESASPHLLRIFDIGTAGAAVFLTLELASGGSLRERLNNGPLPIDEAIRIARAILEGLADLHARGIVHRDVKPGNVLFDANGEVKLADFGLALRLDRDETRATASQALIGTVEYLSPEQVLGEEATERSDLYALGVVFFEMLTGRLPRSGASSLGTLLAHLKDPVPDPRSLRREMPPWLAGLLLSLLERRPADRPTTAMAAVAALRARRGGLGWAWRVWGPRVSLGLGLLASAACALLLRAWTMPRFDHLVQVGDLRIEAIDRNGAVLWSREPANLRSYTVTARLGHGQPARVVTLPAKLATGAQTPLDRRTLSVLDAHTGVELERIELPAGAAFFPGFADSYGARMVATDLDGDEIDEIVVSFRHDSFWPSYTVLYEPELHRGRIIFRGSGHHSFLGAEDLDGDGGRELILAGINNRLGWFLGVAAVRLSPETLDGARDPLDEGTAVSPGLPPALTSRDGLLWYALGPRSYLVPDRPGSVDPTSGRIDLFLTDGRTYSLDRAGFATASDRSATERQVLRRQAFAALGTASEARTAGDTERVWRELEAARRAADAAGELQLCEWLARQRSLALVAHDQATADAELSRLWPQASAPSELAHDAARAFHLVGDFDRAAGWYRKALRDPSIVGGGRGARELWEGLALLQVEHGRARDAMAELAASGDTFVGLNDLVPLRLFVRWRLGLPVDVALAETVITPAAVDLYRYWLLEFRLAAGQSVLPLLEELDALSAGSSGIAGQLESLRAELLERAGRLEEALAASRKGFESLESDYGGDTWARAHVDLALDRWVRLASLAGGAEAERAEAAARRLAARRERDRRLAQPRSRVGAAATVAARP